MREFVTIQNTINRVLDIIAEQKKELATFKSVYTRLGILEERSRIMGIIAIMLPEYEKDNEELHLLFLLSIMERITEQ